MANDWFRFRRFTVHQGLCAMKVGTDGVLLGAWARLSPTPQDPPRVLDVGTGTGLVALMLAQRHGEALVTAIDIEPGAAAQAAHNAALSPFAARVEVQCRSLQRFAGDARPGTFDAVACNPPYFTGSPRCPDPRRTLARHADTLPLGELMAAAARLLTPTGTLSVVLPAEARGEAETLALLAGLRPSRAWSVRTAEGKPPRRVLLEWQPRPEAPVDERTITLGGPEHTRMTEPFLLPRKLVGEE